MSKIIRNGIEYGGTATTANQVQYSPTETVADKIDEIDGKTGSDIPVSSSDSTSVAEAIEIEDITNAFLSSIESGYTLTSGKIYKQGKRIFGNIVINSTSDLPSTSGKVGDIAITYRPAAEVNSFCGVSQTQWNINAVGYAYFGASLAVASGNSGMKFAKINFEYCTN